MKLTKWLRYQWDRALGLVLAVVGAVALLLGYLGLSRNLYPAQQLPYILSGGIVGLFLLGVAGTLWLSADIQDEWRKLRDIEDAVRNGSTLQLELVESTCTTTEVAGPEPCYASVGEG